jgi:hypothetical protein
MDDLLRTSIEGHGGLERFNEPDTKHRILPRTRDGGSLPEPLVVSIDVSEVAFA